MSGETHSQAIKRRYDELQVAHASYQDIYLYLQSSPEEEALEVFKQIRRGFDAAAMLHQIRQGSLSMTQPGAAAEGQPADPPCFRQLLSWRLCRPSPKNNKALALEPDQSTILTLPPRPLDAYKSHSHTDTWTKISWTKAHIHHLVDVILTWDYLPLSLLSLNDFLQSFYTNSTKSCSTALVCALLALAARLVNEDQDDAEILPSGWIGSNTFYKEAQEALQKAPAGDRLPDIQAVGVLSIYRLRCGQETDALDYAESCFTKITDLRNHGQSKDKSKDQQARARDITYLAAVSLRRYVDAKV
jgi:hypothetical protein